MSDRLWVGSRKGLFELRKGKIARQHFAGQPVSAFVSTKKELLCALIRSGTVKSARSGFGGGADAPGIHSILLDKKNITVGISCGGVWKSEDGGKTWALGGPGMKAAYMPPEQQDNPNIQDVHRLAQCAAKPEVLWVQHHSGIYRSTDGGKSWKDLGKIKPSSFGFAVVAHPKDADTAWFVPAIKDELRYPVDGKLVVTRTRDGGKSFKTLRKGLPQEHAYDLIYRHALDIDQTGRQLAIGSTTGGLWMSSNGGDSWQCLNAHLPPIYCVRFN